MEKKVKLLPPMMPNFISVDRPKVERAGEDFKISVAELSEEEATEYGELMKQEFLTHWKYKVKMNGKN